MEKGGVGGGVRTGSTTSKMVEQITRDGEDVVSAAQKSIFFCSFCAKSLKS